MNDATKRKRLVAGHGEQDPRKSNQKKRPGGKLGVAIESRQNKRKKKAIVVKSDEDEKKETEDEDEYEDNNGVTGEDDGDRNGYDDEDDSHSQKQRMMFFEKKLREIKQQKKSKLESSTSGFKKKVKAQEETLIKSLQEQRLNIKLDASAFSKTFSALLNDALSSFPELLTGSPMDPLDLIQNHELYAFQASIKSLSTRLLAAVQSIQATLTRITDSELTLGKGWEQDGDLSISTLREAQQAALLKLSEIISNDGDCEAEGTKEGIEEMTWRHTVKRSKKGIKRLLRNVPVSAIDDTEKF